MKAILTFLILLTCLGSVHSQVTAKMIDSILDSLASKKEHSLSRIKIGNRRTGTVFFYLKSTENIYSIADRVQYFNNSRRADSTAQFKYFFVEDKLVKVIHDRAKINPYRSGYTYLYFSNNSLIDRKNFDDSPDTDVSFVIKKADSLLQKAKRLNLSRRN